MIEDEGNETVDRPTRTLRVSCMHKFYYKKFQNLILHVNVRVELQVRPIHVFRTSFEPKLKIRVGVYEYMHSTNLMLVSAVSWFHRSVFLTR